MSESNPENPEPVKPARKAGKHGGPDFHKSGCRCNACVARRRKAEALTGGTGSPDGGQFPVKQEADSGVILTDLPVQGKGMQRHRIKMWLQWKAMEPSLTHKDAAERLGIAPQTLTNLVHKASKEGWLKFENPMDELEFEIIPKVTHNLKYYLDQGDKDVTIKTAQGTIFKQFLDSKGVKDSPVTVLALKIEMPDLAGASVPNIKGVIVGNPRVIDAEVIESDEK